MDFRCGFYNNRRAQILGYKLIYMYIYTLSTTDRYIILIVNKS